MAQPEGQKRFSPALAIVMLLLVILLLAAFVALRANGGHPGAKPTSHTLPEGSPSK